MTQSRLFSFIEALTNVFIGYLVAILAQVFIFPLYGIHISLSEDFQIATFFTVISLIRSYLLRRFFNTIKK